MLTVAALGGNALLRRGQPMDADTQRANVRQAAISLKPLFGRSRVLVTHGNGPQVGLLALQAAAYKAQTPYPLDVLNAESEGMIGYLIEQELFNQLGEPFPVATLLTMVRVDADDPAFSRPTKPIGPVYDGETAKALAAEKNWVFAEDGEHHRRVVPSPRPRHIQEISTIKLLLAAGVTVICAGGGGIPAVMNDKGELQGIEGVIDKDLTSALLATETGADRLLLLTDVDAVYTDWGSGNQRAIRKAHPEDLKAFDFAPGSMGPKVGAAIKFAVAGKGIASIGNLNQIEHILAGTAGTSISSSYQKMTWHDTT